MTTESDRISRLEGIIEAILERLNSIDNRINAVEPRIETGFTTLGPKIETRFNWMFGLIVTTWITTMIALIAILIKI